MTIQNLFPTPIGIYEINRPLTDEELVFLKNQDVRPNMGNVHSVNNTILKAIELEQISKFIEESVADYFKTVYSPKYDIHLKITQSWTNYTDAGQFHHKHSHPNSFVSGVFYVQADDKKDRIYFYKDVYEQIKLPPQDWNTWNSETWWFEANTGKLILFPSRLTHMVEPVEGEQRISLAFNTFPVGSIGDEMDLTGLSLGELDGTLRIR